MRVKRRIQSGILVLILISAVVIMYKSHIEEKNLASASRTFSELYDDRLLAEHLLYEITELVHAKQLLQINNPEGEATVSQIKLSRELNTLLKKFGDTKLSEGEKAVLVRLERAIAQLNASDTSLSPTLVLKNRRNATFHETFSLLDDLSDIQVFEGTILNKKGQVELASTITGHKFLSALMLIIMLALIALLKNTTITNRIVQQHELN